jgi:DNA (cytosine-5)-methyltransferase 1
MRRNVRVVKVGALCAGYGGLELGLSLAGVDVDLTWYAEIDKHAAQVMGHHHPDVPNLGDLTEITDPPRVDVVTAGFPCQPVSTAGKRKGVNDERWLIEDVCRVAREAGAEWLILENVAGLRSANGGDAMARVVSALAGNGFAAEWTSVRASDVGAPHGRLRWFCLAYADSGRYGTGQDGGRVGRVDGSDEGGTREREWSRPVVGDRSHETAADAGRFGAQVPGQRGLSTVEESGSVGPQGRTDFGPYADAVARWEPIVGRPAPDPTDDRRRLNPRFVEWMMGLPDGWVTDTNVTRSQALKILGNGVVPQQAAFALRLLSEQAVAA